MSPETSSSPDVVLLHPEDNVCVAARDLAAGTRLDLTGHDDVILSEPVRLAHKVALRPIGRSDPVVKYGHPIGAATREIRPGNWVHTHNLAIGPLSQDYASASCVPPAPEPIRGRTFLGYRRGDGRSGTRNYLAVVSTVNCSASVCRQIARHFDRSRLSEFPNVDGVVALTHDTGCGIELGGIKHQMLDRVLRGVIGHPNVGACLVIGLGCEQCTADRLEKRGRESFLRAAEKTPVPFVSLSMQELGGTTKTIERGVAVVEQLLKEANRVRRESIPASQLVLATQCGGSDGNSGITANPALGVASDMLVACGGTVILGETTELFGAEHLLTRRARTPQVADKLIERLKWWRWYTGHYGVEFDNNPSVGNKEGGLTTIAEKSLGAVTKGGSTALVDVYQYAEPVAADGLVIMDTPGFDPASLTGMIAGGANVVVMTTGRGSCLGTPLVPTVKIASNTPLFERMPHDMDIDAGTILSGTPLLAVGASIFDALLSAANGEKTKSEMLGLGEEEFVPWTVGPVL